MKLLKLRTEAMKWWNDMVYVEQYPIDHILKIVHEFYPNRHWGSLTGREIQEIYAKKVLNQ